MTSRFSRLGILIGALAVATVVGSVSPRHAAGAVVHQAAPTSTVNATTIDPSLLKLPTWALPAGASVVDTQALTGSTCVPATSPGITDEFLLEHQEWCQGLNAVTGMYQDFRLDPSNPTPYIGEWAASVYSTSTQAQAVVQTITSHLSSASDLSGQCSAAPNCVLASFEDEETITNPDGTTSPGPTHDVEYALWSEGNIVAEVAVAFEQTQSGTIGRGYRDTMISNGAVLLSEILAGRQPAPPTATPTAQPTATSTPTPSPTVTPVPTATSVPKSLTFSVKSVKVAYGSSKPENAAKHASLASVHVGQNVKLLLYVAFQGISGHVSIRLGFRVTRGSSTVLFKSEAVRVSATDNGGVTAFWLSYKPNITGKYTFSGTVFVDTRHQHKAVSFTVT